MKQPRRPRVGRGVRAADMLSGNAQGHG